MAINLLKKNNDQKQIASNYIALLLIQVTNVILPLITLPYLVRTLGSEKYGLVMIAHSLIIFLTIIADFGFNISATRKVSLLRENKDKLSQYYWNVFFYKVYIGTNCFSCLIIIINLCRSI